jgi:hypothetical protein
MTRVSLVIAFLVAVCSSATAQTTRAGDDPALNPDYDPNKPAATTTTTTTTTTHAQASVPGGMPRNAFLFEARLSLGGTVAGGYTPDLGGATGTPTASSIPGIIAQPSLLLGARLIDRIQIGLGISFVRIGVNGFSTNNVVFLPSVAVDLVKSHDNKTAFYIKAGLGFGASVASASGVHDTSAIIDFDVALGARHALSSNFGLGFEAGLAASVTNPGENSQSDVVFLYGALVGTFWSGNGR